MWRSKCPRRTKSRLNHECDRVDRRFSHSHCFGRDGRPTSPKMQFGKHRLRGASVLHRYAAPRSLPCFIPTLLGHHSSRGSRPDTETLHTQPLLADGARRSLAAAPLPRHLHHTHRPPPTPDEPAARAADRRNGSPSIREHARPPRLCLAFPLFAPSGTGAPPHRQPRAPAPTESRVRSPAPPPQASQRGRGTPASAPIGAATHCMSHLQSETAPRRPAYAALDDHLLRHVARRPLPRRRSHATHSRHQPSARNFLAYHHHPALAYP